MAFDIHSIAQVYQNNHLRFSIDEQRNIIFFTMKTKVSADVRFNARLVNPRTALFTTILPMNIPEENRAAVSDYITRVNYTLLLGSFQLDLTDGELGYKAAGVFEEESGLPDSVVMRLTYVGFSMFDKYMPGVFAIVYGGKSAADAFAEINSKED
ncbi:MAG: YbjN domain-containing protein [Butyricicoccus sp.]